LDLIKLNLKIILGIISINDVDCGSGVRSGESG